MSGKIIHLLTIEDTKSQFNYVFQLNLLEIKNK